MNPPEVSPPNLPKSILFLCINNATLSQMAEGLAKLIFDGQIQVQSAGKAPTLVHPWAVSALADRGIDISNQYAKGLEEIDFTQVDCIIELLDGDSFKNLPPTTRRLRWPMKDPATSHAQASVKGHLAQFEQTMKELELRLNLLREQGLKSG